MSRIWILGAPDPEMEVIEALLRESGERVAYAVDERGERVHPGNAYRGACHRYATDCGTAGDPAEAWYLIECSVPTPDGCPVHVVDHHRPGDPGYGRPPAEFLAASSIGQVMRELDRLGVVYTVPEDAHIVAAADHCLGAAYRGECPGVAPDLLMRWRAETRAAHQGRSVDDVLADIALAQEALAKAPKLALMGRIDGDWDESTFHIRPALPGRKIKLPDLPYFIAHHTIISDLRHAYTVSTVLVAPFAEGATVDAAGVGDSREVVFGARDEGAWDEGGHHTFVRRGVPELPEAASREGLAYLATVTDRDGREKVVLGGFTTPELVRTFMEQWAPSEGLVDIYGDPARGFAGGYVA